jgi:hypothetical protein
MAISISGSSAAGKDARTAKLLSAFMMAKHRQWRFSLRENNCNM